MRRNWLTPVPTVAKTNLLYCQQNQVDCPSLSDYGSWSFRLNCLFEPCVLQTMGGHQPNGYDLWTTQYERLVTTGAKIHVKLTTKDQNNHEDMIFGYVINEDEIKPDYSSLSSFLEDSKTRWFLSGNNVVDRLRKGITIKWSARKFFKSRDILSNPDFAELSYNPGGVNNPKRIAYIHFYMFRNPSLGTGQVLRNFYIKMNFATTWLDRQNKIATD